MSMIPNGLPVSQFFERAGAETPPILFIVPIMLAILFLPLIDLFAGLGARMLPHGRQVDGEGGHAVP